MMLLRAALCLAGVFAAAVAAQTPQVHKGLELTVLGVERAANVRLADCPPGANTVGSTAKPGEEFAVVTVRVRVLPVFKPGAPMRRPALTDASGKSYNTAVSFVDLGQTPEFTCAFPFRVPAGTALRTLNVDGAVLDLEPFQK